MLFFLAEFLVSVKTWHVNPMTEGHCPVHKAPVCVMVAEAIKASSRDSSLVVVDSRRDHWDEEQ